MAAHQPTVLASYQQALPVLKSVFDNRGGVELDPADTAPLGDWLKANDPKEYSVFPGGRELTQNPSNSTSPVNATGP